MIDTHAHLDACEDAPTDVVQTPPLVWFSPSARRSRARQGQGPGGAPNALNELDPQPQTCYASGADATGYLLPLVTATISPRC